MTVQQHPENEWTAVLREVPDEVFRHIVDSKDVGHARSRVADLLDQLGVAELHASLVALERTATVVDSRGAKTGPQWFMMKSALIKARLALRKAKATSK